MTRVRHRQLVVNGVRLAVAEAGPADGPLLIFLHGFPEDWRAWRGYLERFARRGYRVLAPDQRGYFRSEKPHGIAAYAIAELRADMLDLVADAGRERAVLIGHDWGGAVAWSLAECYPERVERLIVLNMPHPYVLRRQLRRNPRQQLRSWYTAFLQLPWLPECAMRWRLSLSFIQASAGSDAFSRDELAELHAAWAAPGAMRSMINWYRAARRWRWPAGAPPRIHPPTLLIWGARDWFLGPELAQPSIDLCRTGRLEWLADASHWCHREHPERIDSLVVDFLGN